MDSYAEGREGREAYSFGTLSAGCDKNLFKAPLNALQINAVPFVRYSVPAGLRHSVNRAPYPYAYCVGSSTISLWMSLH